LNETVSYANPDALETEYQANMSDSYNQETVEEDWGGELLALVRDNQLVLVKMNGVVMTLGEAMTVYSYPQPMTEKDVPLVMSDVLQLLANRVIETEEGAEEEEPEEEEPAKTEKADQKTPAKAETPKVKADSKPVDTMRQLKKETDGAKPSEAPVDGTLKKPSSVIPVKTEVDSRHAKNFVDKPNAVSTKAAEALTGASRSPETPAPRPVIHVAQPELTSLPDNQLAKTSPAVMPEIDSQPPKPAFEIPSAEAAANPIIEASPIMDRPQFFASQETEFHNSPVAMEDTPEPESAQLLQSDFKQPTFIGEATEPTSETAEIAEDGLEPAKLDYQADNNIFTEFVEEEVLVLDYPQKIGVEPTQPGSFSDADATEVITDKPKADEPISVAELVNESNVSDPVIVTSREQLVQTSLVIEEIEDSLIQLAERLEACEPETAKEVNEILDKIMEVQATFEVPSGENTTSETEAQEALEELFTKLFEPLDMEYKPQLIEYLVQFTILRFPTDQIEIIGSEAEYDITQDAGTHEIIKKILAGTSNIKKEMDKAAAIGKSAIRLYAYDFPLEFIGRLAA
jgi:uncharacterized coiled-coil protein SlyX